jgi:hypothetical protein
MTQPIIVTLNITGSAAQLEEVLHRMNVGIEGGNPVDTTLEPAPAPAPRGRKPKAAPAPEAPEEDLGLGETAKEEKKVTIDDVRTAMKAYVAKNSSDKAKAILAKFGVKSILDLKEKDYANILPMIES